MTECIGPGGSQDTFLTTYFLFVLIMLFICLNLAADEIIQLLDLQDGGHDEWRHPAQRD